MDSIVALNAPSLPLSWSKHSLCRNDPAKGGFPASRTPATKRAALRGLPPEL